MKHYTIEATGFADAVWATCGDKRILVPPHQQFVLAEEAAAALAEERDISAKMRQYGNDGREAWLSSQRALGSAEARLDDAHHAREALAARVKELEAQLSGLSG